MVMDDFYTNPDMIRQKALSMAYSEPENFTGWRTRAYHPKGIKERIEHTFRIRIKYWEEGLNEIEIGNGVFFLSHSSGPCAEAVCIHYDHPANWATLLIYFTPNAPLDAGTSIWRHRETGLISKPTKRDVERLGISIQRLSEILEKDQSNPRRWREIDRVGNVYNRAVMFPAGLFHSATRHFGNSKAQGRIYQSFHFSLQRFQVGCSD